MVMKVQVNLQSDHSSSSRDHDYVYQIPQKSIYSDEDI